MSPWSCGDYSVGSVIVKRHLCDALHNAVKDVDRSTDRIAMIVIKRTRVAQMPAIDVPELRGMRFA